MQCVRISFTCELFHYYYYIRTHFLIFPSSWFQLNELLADGKHDKFTNFFHHKNEIKNKNNNRDQVACESVYASVRPKIRPSKIVCMFFFLLLDFYFGQVQRCSCHSVNHFEAFEWFSPSCVVSRWKIAKKFTAAAVTTQRTIHFHLDHYSSRLLSLNGSTERQTIRRWNLHWPFQCILFLFHSAFISFFP